MRCTTVQSSNTNGYQCQLMDAATKYWHIFRMRKSREFQENDGKTACHRKNFQFFSSSHRTMKTPMLANPSDNGFALYKIAFQWYSTIGVIAMWIPAIIVSHLTGGTDFKTFNFKLLSPCIEALMPRKYRHTEMKLISSVGQQSQNKSDNQIENKTATETVGWIFRNDDNIEIKT